MSIGLLFWMIMILWLVFGFYHGWPARSDPAAYWPLGGNLLLFILLFLIGWKVFGFILQP